MTRSLPPSLINTLVRLFVMISLGIVTGCTAVTEFQVEVAETDPAGRAVFDDWLARRADRQTLQGIAKIRVQAPDRTANGTQVILVEEPERLRAETLSPFGTPVLVMTANETEMAVLVPADARLYRGRPTPENLGRFTHLPFHLSDLVGILLGKPPLAAPDCFESARSADGGWLITLKSGQHRQELRFDAARHLTTVQYLAGTELQLRLSYGDYDAGPQATPRRIDVELPGQQVQASLAFRELEMNRRIAPEMFTLATPSGTTVTFLDEPSAVGDFLSPESN